MEKYKKAVKSFLNSCWNERVSVNEGEALYSIFSQQLIINSPLGKTVGLSNFSEINKKWHQAFPDIHISHVEIENYGSTVIANWESQGTHLENFKGVSPTGKEIHYPGETIFYFNQEGKVVRYSCKVDMMSIFSQLGFYLQKEEYDNQCILKKNKKLLIGKINELFNHQLTPKEAQCVSLYLLGFSAKQIGLILFISFRTAETHLNRGLHHCGCHSKLQCVEMMLEKNLLPLWQDLGKILLSEYEAKKGTL